jgi:hypothetical protein
MTNDLEIKLHKACLTPDLKGSVCKPSVSICSSAFAYRTALDTNIAETWKRAVDAMGERTRERVAA